MAVFSDLPAELRLTILEYAVIGLSAPLAHKVDNIDPNDWTSHSRSGVFEATNPLIHMWSKILLPLRLLNKSFCSNTIYVWERLVSPQLPAIVNVDCLAYQHNEPARNHSISGRSSIKTASGRFIQWLSLPSDPSQIQTIQIRMNFATAKDPSVIKLLSTKGCKANCQNVYELNDILGLLRTRRLYPFNQELTQHLKKFQSIDIILQGQISQWHELDHRLKSFVDGGNGMKIVRDIESGALFTEKIVFRIQNHIFAEVKRSDGRVDTKVHRLADPLDLAFLL